eukprot:c5533_g1_i1.p1 GENE.c5533_g1_i1~~c5533_g1_i1.p1  ORF type:complete len:301 (-),score=40.20 c5533_g1_i1:336-1238(-)
MDPVAESPYAAMPDDGELDRDRGQFGHGAQFLDDDEPQTAYEQQPDIAKSYSSRRVTIVAAVSQRLGAVQAGAKNTLRSNSAFAWALFTIGAALELVTAILPALVLSGTTSSTWKIYVWSTLVRIFIWFIIATIVAPSNSSLLSEMLRFDTLSLSATGSMVGYAYLVEFSLGELEWRRAATLAYFVYLVFFLGYFRTMVAYFPFSQLQFYVYSIVRVAVLIFFLNDEIRSEIASISASTTETNLDGQKRRAIHILYTALNFNFIYDMAVRVIDAMRERKEEGNGRDRTHSSHRDVEMSTV